MALSLLWSRLRVASNLFDSVEKGTGTLHDRLIFARILAIISQRRLLLALYLNASHSVGQSSGISRNEAHQYQMYG
jgi:hypothetical protein